MGEKGTRYMVVFLLSGVLSGLSKALADTLAHHKRIDIFEDRSGFWSWDSKKFAFGPFNFNAGHLASDSRTALILFGFAIGGLNSFGFSDFAYWWLCHFAVFNLFYHYIFLRQL